MSETLGSYLVQKCAIRNVSCTKVYVSMSFLFQLFAACRRLKSLVRETHLGSRRLGSFDSQMPTVTHAATETKAVVAFVWLGLGGFTGVVDLKRCGRRKDHIRGRSNTPQMGSKMCVERWEAVKTLVQHSGYRNISDLHAGFQVGRSWFRMIKKC